MTLHSEVLIEVCAGSMADLAAALAVGADRIELCAALELGGLTPSIGLVEAAVAASSLPVIVMVRPRAGGFCYDPDEFAVMLRDAERFSQLGVAGVAFGVLDRTQRVDVARSREIIDRVKPRTSVFHRAFDFVANQPEQLAPLLDLGCTRVLTSGGKPTAAEGMEVLRNLIALAGDRIEIMAGGGITADNMADIVRRTGCRQVHLGASSPFNDGSLPARPSIELSDARFLSGTNHKAVDQDRLLAAVSALRSKSAGERGA